MPEMFISYARSSAKLEFYAAWAFRRDEHGQLFLQRTAAVLGDGP